MDLEVHLLHVVGEGLCLPLFLSVGLGSSLTPALPHGQWLTNVSDCGATWSRTVLIGEAVGTWPCQALCTVAAGLRHNAGVKTDS